MNNKKEIADYLDIHYFIVSKVIKKVIKEAEGRN